jgi:hypothetical protein
MKLGGGFTDDNPFEGRIATGTVVPIFVDQTSATLFGATLEYILAAKDPNWVLTSLLTPKVTMRAIAEAVPQDADSINPKYPGSQ